MQSSGPLSPLDSDRQRREIIIFVRDEFSTGSLPPYDSPCANRNRPNRFSSGGWNERIHRIYRIYPVPVTTHARTDRFHRKVHARIPRTFSPLPFFGRESDESVDRAEAENRGYILGKKEREIPKYRTRYNGGNPIKGSV